MPAKSRGPRVGFLVSLTKPLYNRNPNGQIRGFCLIFASFYSQSHI